MSNIDSDLNTITNCIAVLEGHLDKMRRHGLEMAINSNATLSLYSDLEVFMGDVMNVYQAAHRLLKWHPLDHTCVGDSRHAENP